MEMQEKPVCPSERYASKAEITLGGGSYVCATYLSFIRTSGLQPDTTQCPACPYNPDNFSRDMASVLTENIRVRADLTARQKKRAEFLGREVSEVFSEVERILKGVRRNGK
jgi:hypothetical protein